MEKHRFTPGKVRVVYTPITERFGRKMPYTAYRQLGMAGIRDVYLLLSEQEIADAKVEKILIDTPESDFDIQMGAAKYGGINLHIINTHDLNTEEEKLNYFHQLERIDHSPYCSTIVVGGQNTGMAEINESMPVQVSAYDFWLSDSQWIMGASTKINELIYQDLKNKDMTKEQKKQFFELRMTCANLLKRYFKTVELRKEAEENLESIRKIYVKDAYKTGAWQEDLVRQSIKKRRDNALEKLTQIEDSAHALVEEMVGFIETFQEFRSQFLSSGKEAKSKMGSGNDRVQRSHGKNSRGGIGF